MLYLNRPVGKNFTQLADSDSKPGTSEGPRQSATEQPASKKTFTTTQAAETIYQFTLTDSQSWRRQINNSTVEHTNVTATTEAENQSSHTQSSVSDDQSDSTATNRIKKPVTKRTMRKTENYQVRLLTATLNINKNNHMLSKPIKFESYKIVGLGETGAVQRALSENELRKISTAHPEALLQELPSPTFKIQIANGKIVPVRKQVSLRFTIAGKVCEEIFMVLQQWVTSWLARFSSKKTQWKATSMITLYTSRIRHCNWNMRKENTSGKCADYKLVRYWWYHRSYKSWFRCARTMNCARHSVQLRLPISHPQSSAACDTRHHETGKQQDSQSNHQPKLPYIHDQPRCSVGKFYNLYAEPSQKGQTRVTGKTQSNQSIPGRSTSNDRPTAPRAHLQWWKKMVLITRHVHWSWNPQYTGKTKIWQSSKPQCTREAGSNQIRQKTTDFPLPSPLGQLATQPLCETMDQTAFIWLSSNICMLSSRYRLYHWI